MGKATEDRWCILRTSGGRTLALAASLSAAGIDAWTPAETSRRLIRRGRVQERREVTGPILPTFVFAPKAHVTMLLAMADDPASRRNLSLDASDPNSRIPDFSVFHHGGRIPYVGGRDIAALKAAEAEALAAIEAVREADTQEVARRERAAMLRTAQAQRKALRSVRRQLAKGAAVTVYGASAFAGMSGQVVESKGNSALVFFGGSLTMQIEAWQLVEGSVDPDATDAA